MNSTFSVLVEYGVEDRSCSKRMVSCDQSPCSRRDSNQHLLLSDKRCYVRLTVFYTSRPRLKQNVERSVIRRRPT